VQAATTRGSLLYYREHEHIHRLTAAGEDVWVVSSPRGGFSLPAILTRLHKTEQGVFGFGGKNVQTQSFG